MFIQFSSCSVHLFLADHEPPPMFMFSSCSVHTSAPKRFFALSRRSNHKRAVFRNFDTRYSTCILHPSLSRAHLSSPSLSISLSRALSSIRSDHAHMPHRFRQVLFQGRCTRSAPVAQLHVSISHARGPPRCSTARIHLSRAYSVLLRSPAHIHCSLPNHCGAGKLAPTPPPPRWGSCRSAGA